MIYPLYFSEEENEVNVRSESDDVIGEFVFAIGRSAGSIYIVMPECKAKSVFKT